MKNSAKKIAFWLTLLSGIGLLYLGLNFYINPQQAELNYGIHTSTGLNYSFHYIKGIRDFFFGVIILWFLWRKQYNALGWALIFGTFIPIADFVIVMSQSNFSGSHLISHAVAVFICLGCGIYYTKNYKV